ncbi:hypothetical protein BKA93DRAFT_614988 [Sparassis latifolia]
MPASSKVMCWFFMWNPWCCLCVVVVWSLAYQSGIMYVLDGRLNDTFSFCALMTKSVRHKVLPCKNTVPYDLFYRPVQTPCFERYDAEPVASSATPSRCRHFIGSVCVVPVHGQYLTKYSAPSIQIILSPPRRPSNSHFKPTPLSS